MKELTYIHPQTTHLLIKTNEISLKGRNRVQFERRLLTNLSKFIGENGTILQLSGRFMVELKKETLNDSKLILDIVGRMSNMSGVNAIAPCRLVDADIEAMKTAAQEWAAIDLERNPDLRTFAVRARRVEKKFPLEGTEVNTIVGSHVRKLKPELTTDLKDPDFRVSMEIRKNHVILYSFEKDGPNGLPQDNTQRVLCLLSGGIDSPVAAAEIMRRGISLVFVHFHSRPFTSEASIEKVKKLAEIVQQYSPTPIELWLVPLLEVQKAVRDNCNERYRTIHYRRFMMRIAEELARRVGAKAIVTGDALGQVASQTLTNIGVIEEPIKLPVLRPLISWDKAQIIARAREIGTYETSILPHDDSCILFAPENPTTQANMRSINEDDIQLPAYKLIFSALDSSEKLLVRNRGTSAVSDAATYRTPTEHAASTAFHH